MRVALENRTALVTGGASGLGNATARRLHAAGARVVLADLDAETGAKEAEALGEGALFVATNVADEDAVSAALDAAEARFGTVNVLVNCAGIAIARKTLSRRGVHDLETFLKVLSVNVGGSFNTARLMAERLARTDAGEDGERGVIINTASVAYMDGQKGQAAYSASKAGIVGMTLPIARDLAELGVRINVIAPGLMGTPAMMAMPEDFRQGLERLVQYPKRLGQPEEFALLATQIVENPYLNGETIRLDGAIRM